MSTVKAEHAGRGRQHQAPALGVAGELVEVGGAQHGDRAEQIEQCGRPSRGIPAAPAPAHADQGEEQEPP